MDARMTTLIRCVMENRGLIVGYQGDVEPEMRMHQIDALSAIRRYHSMMDDPISNSMAHLYILGSLKGIINEAYDEKSKELEAQTA